VSPSSSNQAQSSSVCALEETLVNTEALQDAADQALRSRMTKHIRTAPQAGVHIPRWLGNDPGELHYIEIWQEQAIDDMQLRQAADQLGPVWGQGPVARRSTMKQINERAAVVHSTYIYPREDCKVSAGEQQWMVDQCSIKVDEEGIAQGHPHMPVPARSAMKRQDRREATAAGAGSGRHVAWATQADLLAHRESSHRHNNRAENYWEKHNCKSLRGKDVR
jgi:hypothetical protein